MSEFDITALVYSEHEAFRRAFADLEQAAEPGTAWQELADRLEVHAAAEEEVFYPLLATVADDGVEEGKSAVREHNDIRHSVDAVMDEDPQSPAWRDAVRCAQEVNAEHMAQEEREFIPDFKDNVDESHRDDLGMKWLKFHDDHERAKGLSGDDADPQAVVDAEPV